MEQVKSFYESYLHDDGENVWIADKIRRDNTPYTCTIEYCLIKQRHEYRRVLEMIEEMNSVYTGISGADQQKIREEVHEVLTYKPKYRESFSSVSEALNEIITLDYNAKNEKETENE